MHSSHGSTRWGVIVCLVLLILSATTFAEDYTYNFSLAPLRDGCGDGEELQLVNDVVYTAFLKHLSTLESATTPVLLSKAVFDPRKKWLLLRSLG
ncbi:hypothetical protein ADEAN_000512100 [Angomonas deanei]|uniref:Uncharacterized protein n=1 Tax=Angomonas deanei TaxID=59799 RepID=A0A7G2CHF1_9TRYP|nr:hypothetical protein ADEAN_000512100 [Angomonas deanei]